VDRVIDGDTLDLTDGTRVRLYGVDTPERGEPCFTEATDRLRQLAGSTVRLENGPRATDSFGRRLAYAYRIDGFSIDVILIGDGLAEAWTRDGQHRDTLVGLEQSARENRVGCLWGDVDKANSDDIESTVIARVEATLSSLVAIISVPTVVPTPDPKSTAFTSFNHFLQITGVSESYGGGVEDEYDQYRFAYVLEMHLLDKHATQAGFESFVKTYLPFRDNWRTAFWSKVTSLFESVDRSFRLGTATEALTRVSLPSSADEALFWNPLLDVMARHRFSDFYWGLFGPSPDRLWREYILTDRTPYPLWFLEDWIGMEICPTSKYDAPGSNC
jgi:hypothetical protein